MEHIEDEVDKYVDDSRILAGVSDPAENDPYPTLDNNPDPTFLIHNVQHFFLLLLYFNFGPEKLNFIETRDLAPSSGSELFSNPGSGSGEKKHSDPCTLKFRIRPKKPGSESATLVLASKKFLFV